IARTLFGLRDSVAYGPSPRSMLSYLIRRQSSGAFQDTEKHTSMQALWDQQVNLSYLIGLDWGISTDWQQTRLKERTLKELKKAAKEGALGNPIGDVAELRTTAALAASSAA